MKYLFEDKFEFSYSDLKDYGICPYRFGLRYQLKKKSIFPHDANSRRYVGGWCGHKCVELWNRLGHWANGWMFDVVVRMHFHGPRNSTYDLVGRDEQFGNLVEEVMRDYLEKNNVVWRDEEDQDNVVEEIKESLKIVEHWIKDLGMNHDQMESERKFNFYVPNLNVVVKGFIDLVDHNSKCLYDFKFSRSGYVDWKQLLWYDLMVWMETDTKVSKVFTFNPYQPEPLEEKEYGDESLQELYSELKTTVLKIRDGQLSASPHPRSCSECSVQSFCDYRSRCL